jgi:hypothetical protein
MNGNGQDKVGGAHAVSGINVGSTENRFGVQNKATMFASGYYVISPSVFFTESDFTATAWVKVSKYSSYGSVFDFGTVTIVPGGRPQTL